LPRQSRLDLAGFPQLVLLRGLERKPAFRCTADFCRYLEELRVSSASYGCVVHAYALLPAEVRLLITGSVPGAVSRMMQSLGRRYAYFVNAREGSKGTCWRGRYHSCPVGHTHALLASGYVELSPIKAGLVSNAAAYRWSSYACNALGIPNPVISPPPGYLALAEQDCEKRARYRELLAGGLNGETILMHLQQGRAWGDARFLQKVARLFGDRGTAKPRGRPRKLQPSPKVVPIVLTTLSPFLLTRWIESGQTLGTMI
jgi:putative transposase